MKLLLTGILLSFSLFATAQDTLPSWNDGKSKADIMNYVKAVTDKNSSDFVEPKDRIAVFDNDGTLWSEQPVYFQLFFIIDRVKALASEHPEWKTRSLFKQYLKVT